MHSSHLSLNFALGWNYSDCCSPDMFQLLTLCQLIILRSKLYIFWHVTQMDLFLTCFHQSVILSVCVCHPRCMAGTSVYPHFDASLWCLSK